LNNPKSQNALLITGCMVSPFDSDTNIQIAIFILLNVSILHYLM